MAYVARILPNEAFIVVVHLERVELHFLYQRNHGDYCLRNWPVGGLRCWSGSDSLIIRIFNVPTAILLVANVLRSLNVLEHHHGVRDRIKILLSDGTGHDPVIFVVDLHPRLNSAEPVQARHLPGLQRWILWTRLPRNHPGQDREWSLRFFFHSVSLNVGRIRTSWPRINWNLPLIECSSDLFVLLAGNIPDSNCLFQCSSCCDRRSIQF